MNAGKYYQSPLEDRTNAVLKELCDLSLNLWTTIDEIYAFIGDRGGTTANFMRQAGKARVVGDKRQAQQRKRQAKQEAKVDAKMERRTKAEITQAARRMMEWAQDAKSV